MGGTEYPNLGSDRPPEDEQEFTVGEPKVLQFPQYKCHKVVGALKIVHVNHKLHYLHGSAELHPEDKSYDNINVSRDFCRRHDLQDGGYYVIYEDGYASWSPAKAFEDGYDLIT